MTYQDFLARVAAQNATADAVSRPAVPTPVSTVAAQVRAVAATAHAAYPQYNGYWDGAEWRLVRIRRNVRTKAGVAFCKGDYTLLRHAEYADGPSETAYSIRNQCNTGLLVRDFEEVTTAQVGPVPPAGARARR